jgi:PhnB protein
MNASNNNGLVQPYVFFEGRCEEAIEFYKKALGAEVLVMLRFKDSPVPPPPGLPPGSENKIMHAQARIGQTVLMLGDGRCSGKPAGFQGFGLSLSLANETEVDKAFKALADGGQVQMPLEKTFFSPRFGMVIDRFGVMWMVLVQQMPQK